MNVPQTSASERIERARDAIAAAEASAESETAGVEDLIEHRDALIDVINELITPPAVGESEEEIVKRLYRSVSNFPMMPDGDALREIFLLCIRAGIQAAHETWEPADVPSQEFMLRHLGIEYEDAREDEGDPDTIRIRTQYIAKEES